MTKNSGDGWTHKRISIHIPRVGDDLDRILPALDSVISIHIPRVGDDAAFVVVLALPGEISIHIPRVGDDRFVHFVFQFF